MGQLGRGLSEQESLSRALSRDPSVLLAVLIIPFQSLPGWDFVPRAGPGVIQDSFHPASIAEPPLEPRASLVPPLYGAQARSCSAGKTFPRLQAGVEVSKTLPPPFPPPQTPPSPDSRQGRASSLRNLRR